MKNYDKIIDRIAAAARPPATDAPAAPRPGFETRVLGRVREVAADSATAVWQWFALRALPIAAALCLACLFATLRVREPMTAGLEADAAAMVESVFESTLLP